MSQQTQQKVVIVGAGPVGSLAALYAAARGDEVEVYELRGGKPHIVIPAVFILVQQSGSKLSVACCGSANHDPIMVYACRNRSKYDRVP